MAEYDLGKLEERIATLESAVDVLSRRNDQSVENLYTLGEAADLCRTNEENLRRWLSYRKATFPARYLHYSRIRRRRRFLTDSEIKLIRTMRGSGAMGS